MKHLHKEENLENFWKFLGCLLFRRAAAGKTTFIKGLIHAAAQIASSEVQSPTFNYLNIYEGRKTIYHFDLYRLRDRDEFLSMGFDEFFDAGGICCIEWSERIEPSVACAPNHCHVRAC